MEVDYFIVNSVDDINHAFAATFQRLGIIRDFISAIEARVDITDVNGFKLSSFATALSMIVTPEIISSAPLLGLRNEVSTTFNGYLATLPSTYVDNIIAFPANGLDPTSNEFTATNLSLTRAGDGSITFAYTPDLTNMQNVGSNVRYSIQFYTSAGQFILDAEGRNISFFPDVEFGASPVTFEVPKTLSFAFGSYYVQMFASTGITTISWTLGLYSFSLDESPADTFTATNLYYVINANESFTFTFTPDLTNMTGEYSYTVQFFRENNSYLTLPLELGPVIDSIPNDFSFTPSVGSEFVVGTSYKVQMVAILGETQITWDLGMQPFTLS